MKPSTTLLSLLTTLLSPAAALPQGSTDYNQLQFRSYGGSDCFTENQGVYSLHTEDINICKPLTIQPVGSVLVQKVANDKCHLAVFKDSGCTGGETAPLGSCFVGAEWKAYKLVCPIA